MPITTIEFVKAKTGHAFLVCQFEGAPAYDGIFILGEDQFAQLTDAGLGLLGPKHPEEFDPNTSCYVYTTGDGEAHFFERGYRKQFLSNGQGGDWKAKQYQEAVEILRTEGPDALIAQLQAAGEL